jgi:hypothetical protein
MDRITVIAEVTANLRKLNPYDQNDAEKHLIYVLDNLEECDEINDRAEALFWIRQAMCEDDHPNCFSAFTILERLGTP